MASNDEQRLIEAARAYVAEQADGTPDEMELYASVAAGFALSPSVVHRIERAFADRVKARIVEQMGVTSAFYDRAMDAELKEDVKG